MTRVLHLHYLPSPTSTSPRAILFAISSTRKSRPRSEQCVDHLLGISDPGIPPSEVGAPPPSYTPTRKVGCANDRPTLFTAARAASALSLSPSAGRLLRVPRFPVSKKVENGGLTHSSFVASRRPHASRPPPTTPHSKDPSSGVAAMELTPPSTSRGNTPPRPAPAPLLFAPVPVSASQASFLPTRSYIGALGLNVEPPSLRSGPSSDYATEDVLQSEYASVESPPLSRSSSRLQRIAPPPLQIPVQSPPVQSSWWSPDSCLPHSSHERPGITQPVTALNFPPSAAPRDGAERAQCHQGAALPDHITALGASASPPSRVVLGSPHSHLQSPITLLAERMADEHAPARSPRSPPRLRRVQAVPLPSVTPRQESIEVWRSPDARSPAHGFRWFDPEQPQAGPSRLPPPPPYSVYDAARLGPFDGSGAAAPHLAPAVLSPLPQDLQPTAPRGDAQGQLAPCVQAVSDMTLVRPLP